MQPESGQDIGQGIPCVQEENQGGHQNTPREARLNRDTGLDNPAIILQLVSHDPDGSCDTNGHYLSSPDEGREILPNIRELFPPLFDCVCRMFHQTLQVGMVHNTTYPPAFNIQSEIFPEPIVPTLHLWRVKLGSIYWYLT